MSTLLECKGLFKSYSGRPALKNVNLAIESGHIVGLLGPNGSGKTTLIKLINGLLTPTQGELYINQNPVGVESKKIVSYLPDHTYLDMNLKVRDIISYFMDFYEDFDEKKAYDMLSKLRINPGDKYHVQGYKGKGAAYPCNEPKGKTLCVRRAHCRGGPGSQGLHFRHYFKQL